MPNETKSTQPKKTVRRTVKRTTSMHEKMVDPIEASLESEVMNDTPPVQSTGKTLQQMSQQLNMLLILGIALFLFNMYMFWKVKNLEGTVKTGATAAAGQQAAPEVNVSADQIKKLFGKDYISFGDSNKKVLFVEFSDPSCPYCHLAAGKNPELNEQAGAQFKLASQGGAYVPPVEEMRKLVDEGTASYSFIYRNGHGNGELATQAMYCAHEKGNFWEVHDLLMSSAGYTLINDTVKNDKTSIPVLVEFLGTAMDGEFLTQCLESDKYAERLTRDTDIGNQFGVGGTPGFFVNTKHFPGAYSYTDMKSEVDGAS